MRPTESAITTSQQYFDKVVPKITADGKMDDKELLYSFKTIIWNQAALARAIRDVYDVVARIEQTLKQQSSRGPVGR
ncbi:MAG: hypothetical protein OI74_06695 [Gammaproteobacteria bacterium (ex Lamellibrachia satsuma)]|nr:MAG: hypothetical protein HPY30_08310 [Gammaproteobacteria bacterium (ex Lamellibrachia satsuma)]RRS33748.1 MAG: hypothetical protein OI74_06695 [Gammaproteobacteria bacterium (ex Lamellibrachia satsuma)]RRS37542.1 MAG: hypothetical protein NV67_00325 [Gammaproteobacteria bacterium (ex Lamellibrachia satsuma)]